MQTSDSKLWGLDRDTYQKLATRQSKADMFLWVVGGLTYNFFQGNLISISSGLLILPGIFIASFAGMPALWVNVKKLQIVPKTNNPLVLLGFTLWYLVDLVYPIFLSIVFIKLIGVLL